MAVVYQATNILNGKSYIGFTSRSFVERISGHKRAAQKRNSKFYNAIRKYGWDSFVWSIVLDNATLDDEKFLIEKLDTIHNGYNLKDGGQFPLYSEESKRKMSESAKAKPISDSFREKCRIRMLGNTISPGGKAKAYKVTTPDGLILKIENLALFCRERHLNKSHMSSVANGNRSHHKGYKVEIL